MIELICVRHGRTAWNVDGRFQGQSDVPLDDEGRAQARALAVALRDEPLHQALTSDLARAAETARTILQGRPEVPLAFEPDLREMCFGAWEGLTWAQIRERQPAITADGYHRPKSYTPPDGERFEDVVARVERALARVRAESPENARVLIVTHAAVLHALLRVLLGAAEAAALEAKFAPGSITRFGLAPTHGSLLALNVIAPRSPA